MGVGLRIMPAILLKLPSYKKSKKRLFDALSETYDDHCQVAPGEERHHDLFDVALQAKYEDGQPLSQTDAMANAFYPYVMNAIYTNRTNSYLLYELL